MGGGEGLEAQMRERASTLWVVVRGTETEL